MQNYASFRAWLMVLGGLVMPFLGQCSGDISTAPVLQVNMRGVYELPDPVQNGSFEPRWQKYTVESVFLVPETGDPLAMYSGTPKEHRVINRDLLIYQRELEDSYVGAQFNSLIIRFAAAVTGGGKLKEDHALTLAATDVAFEGPITFVKGQAKVFTVKVQWKNTVMRDDDAENPEETMYPPSLVMVEEK